ncbi:MAG: hypothetical protein OXG91_11545 [bacterium]|nr:hypothetical protein [bacterium]
MTLLRRTASLGGIAAVGTVGLLLVLEITGTISSEWRNRLADFIDTAAFPTWSLWISGLVGGGLALLGLTLVVAQLAPPRKGLTRLFEVYRASDGETRIRGRAAIRAARHEVATIEGVLGADGRIRSKRLHLTLRIDDRVNLADVENEARERLDHEFWIDLGLADFGVNLLVTHHQNPPRTR